MVFSFVGRKLETGPIFNVTLPLADVTANTETFPAGSREPSLKSGTVPPVDS